MIALAASMRPVRVDNSLIGVFNSGNQAADGDQVYYALHKKGHYARSVKCQSYTK